MTERTCSLDGCDLPHCAKGLCSKHYAAAVRASRPKKVRGGKICGVDGCDRPHVAKGMCRWHYNRDWHERNKVRLAPIRAAYAAKTAGARREYVREWHQQNAARRHAEAAARRAANPEATTAQGRRWRADNPLLVLEYAAKRRARLRDAWDEFVDRDLVWVRDGGICHLCGEPADPARWDLDHIVPLTPIGSRAPGRHNYGNVAVAHPSCNYKKCNRESK
jgi:hypothetical protein